MTYLNTPLMRSFIGFDNLFNELENASQREVQNYPSYNIIKIDDDNYRVELALAGFSQNDISIETNSNILTIEAKKTEDNGEYIYKGISNRSFRRQFRLSDFLEVKNAEFNQGLLLITLKRELPEALKPKKIQIKNSSNLSGVNNSSNTKKLA